MALGSSPFAAPAGNFPWSGAAVDLNFVTRRYWWNGAARIESDFTSFTLNGATFGAQGLDCSTATSNPAITLTLASIGLGVPPLCYALAGYPLSIPAATKTVLQIDDGTNNERITVNLNISTGNLAQQVVDGGVNQSNQAATPTLSARFGLSHSIQTNEILAANNGVGLTADVAATMPTVTTLRLACSTVATTFPPAILSRFVIFSAVKVQADVDALSAQIRDTP